MKFALLFMFVVFTTSLFGADAEFYLGTFTDHSTSLGIYRGTIDTATGKLGPITLAVAGKNPNFLAFSPGDKFVYASMGLPRQDTVGAFAVGPGGVLSELDEQPSGGKDSCHVSVDRAGKNVLVANYGSGSIACFRIKPDGSVGERTALITFHGSGPNPQRQKAPYAHSIYTSPDDAFVYACDLGTDHIWIFRFDPALGTLTPTDPPAGIVPPGSGPRHLVFSGDGKLVYVANEMGHSVTVFKRDGATGLLTALETIPTLPPGTPADNVTTAEIVLSPSGRQLYVSNRTCDTIAVMDVDKEGRLTLVQSVPSVVHFPRSFGLDPSGRWLIAAGQKDNRIAVLKIDPATGRLSATDQAAEVGSPVCVLFDKQP